MTPTRTAILAAVLAGAGCRTVSSDPSWASAAPAGVRATTAAPARPGVVPAAHAEPADKFAAQPALPPPRPVEPAPKSAPPAPPTDATPIAGAPPSAGGPLGLDEVLTAVEQHYPLLRAVEQERVAAGGRLLSAMGAFDLNLAASAEGQGTTYDNFRSGLGVSQGIPVAGLGVFAGYRNGYGTFPTYNLGQKTADGGEFRAGVSIPLLQGREIDRPRAAIQQARLDTQIAEPVIHRQRLDFQRAAARTYWAWVGAGHRLKVAEELVRLAVERDEQLRVRVEAGPAANIERVDNQQNIALRNGLMVQAQRAFQQATIELSLFLRDPAGSPTLAGRDRLPVFPEVQPVAAGFEEALRTALANRPEPQRLRLQRERAAVDLRLASNQTLPAVNAVVAAAQDVGYGTSSLSGPNGLDRTTLNAGVAMQLPLQRRDARGREIQAGAQLAQIEAQLRQAEDVVRAEVQDAVSALDRAYEFHRQARQRVELARLVARAEREQLRLGRSDVLRVTLREQAAFDAEIIEIGARQDYFRALAEFRAALGLGGW
ncbi:TolC family protein [Urbifossiella limnaea]|uniref:Outer membrane efflux protein n=1 Tax=Urbifossiella limnaea TaxID=2528023 RepID=A0A517Y1T5_9BACT|nr:TolC family protein [Urbifossiella limnaea]QDU23694.1 Outer membrane efflux protein [Urbifossiella limnaea]